MSEIVVSVCRWHEVRAEVAELAVAHHAKFAKADPELPLAINDRLLFAADLTGALVLAVARRDTRLIGYCCWFVGEALGSVGKLVATQGPWFSAEGGAGLKLLRRGRDELAARGVDLMLLHRHAASDERIDRAFARMGARPYQSIWLLPLRRASNG